MLIVGSGNVVHNLRAIDWSAKDHVFDRAHRFDDAYAMGSLSMTSFTLDAKCPTSDGDERPGAGLPDPRDIPAEDTNA